MRDLSCEPFPAINPRSKPAAVPHRMAARAESRCPPSPIEQAIIDVFEIRAADLRGRDRGPARIAFARQCAMYVAHVTFGRSYSEAGRLFGRDRTTAAHACRIVEDRRDDPDTDAIVRLIECLAQDEPAPLSFSGCGK
jgi:chromosomal replication initiation ATPase DnaA